ncbi:MAG: hypothetical protein P0116_16080 [Candidatus Nitrosocosmicus sp.]|nr:hypothetical protein [Candidatus Nitrosocosmicus sp.]
MKLNNESTLSEDLIFKKVSMLEGEKPLAKALFDKTCERWQGLLYALHKDDREHLLMLLDCCTNVDDGAAKVIHDKVSGYTISILFFIFLGLQNQKLINGFRIPTENNIKTDVNLLDFVK